jgi:hypothetical protein
MMAPGASCSAATTVRVFGPGPGEAFASWDSTTSSWREDEFDPQDPAGAVDPGPEFTAVALAEGRPGGWLNPEWVEWLMGFPAGWSRSTPATEPGGEIGRSGREAAPGAAPRATRVAAATLPPGAGFPHHDDDPRGPEKLRSPRHLEARS